MCELSVYTLADGKREKVMVGVVRIVICEGKVTLEGILGESKVVSGFLAEVDIVTQQAIILPK